MKSSCEEIRQALMNELQKRDVRFVEKAGNLLSIMNRGDESQWNPFSLLCPKSVDFRKYGPRNGTAISGLSYFEFKLTSKDYHSHFIVPILNLQSEVYEFVIIPAHVLIERQRSNGNSESGRAFKVFLQLWLLPDGALFDTTGIGVEGEWFMIQGRMAKNTNYDYSEFLNNWDLIW